MCCALLHYSPPQPNIQNTEPRPAYHNYQRLMCFILNSIFQTRIDDDLAITQCHIQCFTLRLPHNFIIMVELRSDHVILFQG